ncbi:hypothetical protein WK60_28075 [Burkholderia ubonensis]|uniref:Uncharacterized protein n=2 Tax=Burkholderia ubonensis TaxID=101571 RepID=A0ABD6Q0U8_9BURK|nr:hypothetical protein WJ74_30990 [Burkholderia ubonensis]KVT37146.1 hypothetical protein WK51_17040 [Burkholderia ubonensis]KVU04196.1 hypothetical protein WK60_28075 [Burkholderia ubonensis]KVX87276.1 hypothetical protein WL08_31625 [Burkholderia ubonensis]KWC03058.1 hypothetical protein WL44_00960 [Burkholderia ubonensis]
MNPRNALASGIMLLACALAVASQAHAGGPRVIPRSAQVDGGYVSTQLLLKPCLDVRALYDNPDDSQMKDVAAARNVLPPGTCDSPVLVEKVFTARFLQYASLAAVNDPWNLDVKIEAQNRAMDRCKNMRCLDRELDAVIRALSPLYLGVNRGWPRGKGLCASEPADAPVAAALAPLGARARKGLASECGGEALTAQTCKGQHGKLLFVSCETSGNQVNAPAWIYRARHGRYDSLLDVDDGPVGVLESSCNGMPDLMTSSRTSMGEYQNTYYRYDGRAYRSAYSYTGMGVGTDDNGNDLAIAQGGPDAKVVCR